jgi:hypothetical protein
LGVVDHAQQRVFLGRLGEQAEDREADEDPVWRLASAHAKDDLERLTLGEGQRLEPPEQRCAQLMEARGGELHLGLHPDGAQHGDLRRRRDKVVEQRGLADPCLAAEEE